MSRKMGQEHIPYELSVFRFFCFSPSHPPAILHFPWFLFCSTKTFKSSLTASIIYYWSLQHSCDYYLPIISRNWFKHVHPFVQFLQIQISIQFLSRNSIWEILRFKTYQKQQHISGEVNITNEDNAISLLACLPISKEALLANPHAAVLFLVEWKFIYF